MRPLLGWVPGALRLGQLFWVRARTDLWLGRGRPRLPVADKGALDEARPIFETLGMKDFADRTAELSDTVSGRHRRKGAA